MMSTRFKAFGSYVLAVAFMTVAPQHVNAQILEHLTNEFAAEVHYNDEVQNASGEAERGDIDIHKLTFKSTYKIDKHWYVAGKLKVEHAFDSHYNGGDVWVDNFYLKYKKSDELYFQAGIISVPLVGGKPKVYGSVEYSPVEQYLSYSWREAGVGVYGHTENHLNYTLTLTTGLNPAELQTKQVVYNARNSNFFSSLNTIALGFQVDYELTHDVTIGTSALYSGLESKSEFGDELSGANYKIVELFANYSHKNVLMRSVGVYSSVKNSDKIYHVLHNKVGAAQTGALFEIGYDFSMLFSHSKNPQHLYGFVRAEYYDSLHKTSGFSDNSKYERNDYSIGLVYQPLKAFEFKIDYQIANAGGHSYHQMLDFSVGYHF